MGSPWGERARRQKKRQPLRVPAELLGIPDPLEGLDEEVRKIFRDVARALLDAGVPICQLDRWALAAYSLAIRRVLAEEASLAQEGPVLTSPRGRKYANPRLRIARDWWREVLAYAKVLGAGPAARARWVSERLHPTPNRRNSLAQRRA